MAVSEILLANPDVWDTQKTRMRMDHSAEGGLRSVQITGADPEMMAFCCPLYNVEQGAQIVDINMGCPAKVNRLAGSALLRQQTWSIHLPGRGGCGGSYLSRLKNPAQDGIG